ncbi:transposase [Candidatus Daviesbacteria bacterium]|nr:transposase [Candidatus Daviesbacteria bacterium]
MPARNSRKIYVDGSYYHIYNRGVEKRIIFTDRQDYGVFLHYFKEYLSPKEEEDLKKQLSKTDLPYKEKADLQRLLRLNNFHDEIALIAYCLMPNHFHLLIKQKSAGSIDKFMNSLCTRYTMFFNKKHKRVGSLYQDVYKAVLVKSNEQLLHLTSYIHRNPVSKRMKQKNDLNRYLSQPSSLPEYLGIRKTSWVHEEEILPYFSKTNPKLSYKAFVLQQHDLTFISKLAIDL